MQPISKNLHDHKLIKYLTSATSAAPHKAKNRTHNPMRAAFYEGGDELVQYGRALKACVAASWRVVLDV